MTAAITASGTNLKVNGVNTYLFGLNCYFLGQTAPVGGAVTHAQIDAYFASLPPYTLTRFWCSQNIITVVPTGVNWGQVGTIDWTALDYVFQSAVNHNQLLLCSLSQYSQPGEDTGTFDYPGCPDWGANISYPKGQWVVQYPNPNFYYSKNAINSSTPPASDSTNWGNSGIPASSGLSWSSGLPYAAGTWVNSTVTGANLEGGYYALNAMASSTVDPQLDPTNWHQYRHNYSWFAPASGTSGTTGYNAVIPGQVAPLSYKAWVTAVVTRYKNSPAVGMWEPMSEPECDTTFVVNDSMIGTNMNTFTGSQSLPVYSTQNLASGAGSGPFYYANTNNQVNISWTGIDATHLLNVTTNFGGSGVIAHYGHGGCESQAVIGLNAFHTNINNLIKSIDPNHLTCSGMISGGQWGSQNASDIITSHGNLDVFCFHDYNGATALPASASYAIGAAQTATKPILFSESGILNGSDVANAAARQLAFNAKVSAQRTAGAAGILMWNASLDASVDSGYDIGIGDPVLPGNSPSVFDSATGHFRRHN